ncbi:hypothetical protein Ahy_B08g093715 isoform A [Arachis hypogaea]|uniref:SWIM-type domain-containing protein n=1 Tax=Arachis hypogaea TaxID=3818 RepID=A0A444Y6W3_ARAHY|nr:hypothetical protein Ahy_B08g093715 isoform A [Arachis hypogaea]
MLDLEEDVGPDGAIDGVLTASSKKFSQDCINLKEHTCTCNVWQLTELPCKHAVAAIFRLKNMGYKLEDFVDKSLTMDAVRAAYSYVIQPVNSDDYWIPQLVKESSLPNRKGKKE